MNQEFICPECGLECEDDWIDAVSATYEYMHPIHDMGFLGGPSFDSVIKCPQCSTLVDVPEFIAVKCYENLEDTCEY